MGPAGHLKILILSAAILTGAGLVFYSFQLFRRYRYPFLHPMWMCVVFLNLAFLAGLFSDYILVNLFRDVAAFKSSVTIDITDPLASVFFLGLSFCLFALDRALSGGKVPLAVTWAFALAVSVVAVDSMSGLLAGTAPSTLSMIRAMKTGMLTASFVFSLALLVHMIVASERMEKVSGTGGWRLLGSFYAAGCAAVIVSSMFAGSMHGVIFAVISLLMNIFPFYWFRANLVGPGNALEKAVEDVDFSGFYERYGISERQREIAELVLRGKSNRDIADDLFIAPHTVKNHIYNLYKKMGVRSRFELINLFLESKRG
ncbi:MAG TPA: helix-turn-helix transcriptional regulator [Candidatus Krumholzibacterium sp.]|nr:helix-turn-helix transcriptional regulator [Candidatus Krumholzibacterium sp.]